MPVTARLEYVAESEWGSGRHLDVTPPDEQAHRAAGPWGCRKARKNLDGTAMSTRQWAVVEQSACFTGSVRLVFIGVMLSRVSRR